MCSESALHGGELVIFSAHQGFEHRDCGVDCMLVNSTRVHGAGKLTSIPISGEEVPLCAHACVRKKGSCAFDKCWSIAIACRPWGGTISCKLTSAEMRNFTGPLRGLVKDLLHLCSAFVMIPLV